MEKTKRGSFSGKLGYVLAVSGASVGLGNIWRFPYLAAKHGGGIFLLIYIVLALTFGYTMIIAETAIGRSTKKSPVGAFRAYTPSRAGRAGGWLNAIIPILIVPYYSVVGGWVLKYLYASITTDLQEVSSDSYFSSFIGTGWSAEFWFIVFAAFVLLIVFFGIKNGIERVSKIMMPILVILAVIISIFSITRPGALEGVRYFLVPNPSNFTWMTVVTAMEQMFYSLSIAMGILITFGSYMKEDVAIESSTKQVEIFDTGIAIMAGLMIIPAVFSYSGGDAGALNQGASLMFSTMPKIFADMKFGRLIAILFFLLVLFAAVTSAIALMESAIATLSDEFGWSRRKSTLAMGCVMLVLGTLSCLGYGPLSFIAPLGMPFLDFFDFITNSVMMPVAALAICILVNRSIGIARIEEEVELGEGHTFRRKRVFAFMIRYLCPLFVLIILVSSILAAFGIIQK